MPFEAIYNKPTVPFTFHPQGLEGMTVQITGKSLPTAERFQVDFKFGEDQALHFNLCYSEPMSSVVCNTLQGFMWGIEEQKQPCPLRRGHPFTLKFVVNPDSYKIFVNGEHFMDYKHRIPPCNIQKIFIDGEVVIQRVFMHTSFEETPSSNMKVIPYMRIHGIPGGLRPGKTITILGTPKPQADMFVVNLHFNSGIAFQFNPRFMENTVVRNSYLNGSWGLEERSGGMPFHRGQPFKVTFVCDIPCFNVVVNGIHMFTFNHRHDNHEAINILQVAGDIEDIDVQLS